MTDHLSVVLGSTLSKVTVIGAVVVSMKLVLVGQPWLAAAVLSPLVVVAYLYATDGALLA